MYRSYPGLVLGFHGCDEEIGRKVVAGDTPLELKHNRHDWLGHGLYFWEFNPERARQWAEEKRRKGGVDHPFVIGAVIGLGHCLNLLNAEFLKEVRTAHDFLSETVAKQGGHLPKNTLGPDRVKRELDCAVLEILHSVNQDEKRPPFDSVRAAFVEGNKLYPGAGFREKNHIQICVRNPNCIKGYFIPREIDSRHPRPNS